MMQRPPMLAALMSILAMPVPDAWNPPVEASGPGPHGPTSTLAVPRARYRSVAPSWPNRETRRRTVKMRCRRGVPGPAVVMKPVPAHSPTYLSPMEREAAAR